MKYILLAMALFMSIQATQPQPPASLVQTVKIKEGVANALQTYVGTLYYDRHSELASESSGVVQQLYVKEGQSVKKGETLLRLRDSILRAKIEAKEASLSSLVSEQTKQKKDLDRAKALLARKSISQSNYDATFYTLESLNADIKSTKAELLSLKIELSDKTIKAPFSGVIVKRNINIGEWVSVGQSVFTIIDPTSIEAEVNIPSKLIYTLSQKQKLSANIGKDILEVEVKSIVPLADRSSRTFPVKLSLKSEKTLIEGMRIDVKVPTLKEENVLLVPRDAVIKRFGSFVVFSVIEGKAIMNPVVVVNYVNNQAAIHSATLKPDMKVIIKGNERVFPNMPVKEKAE